MPVRTLKKKNDNSPPKEPRIGQLWYDDVTRTLRKWNGQHWGTECAPGEYAKADAENDPVTRLLRRVENELKFTLTDKPENFQAKRITWHGMSYEFLTKSGGRRALAGEHDTLVCAEDVPTLLACDTLYCEIASQKFASQHGVRPFILSSQKVSGA